LSKIETRFEAQATNLKPKFVTLSSGIRVCYVEAGPPDAPALLLTHGFLGSLQDWRYNTTALAELSQSEANFQPRRVIALDWVGFGLTDKPATTYSLDYFAHFLKDFADRLGLQQFDLGGHSMGGKHNLAFAILYPQYVRKLVLSATDGFIQDPKWITQTTNWYFRPLAYLSTVALAQPSVIRASLKPVFFDPKFLPDDEQINEAALALHLPAYRASLRALNRDYARLSMRQTGLINRVSEIKVPVQVFWGLQDHVLEVSNAEVAKQYLPHAEFHLFDNCGHCPHIERSEEFNRLVLEFLEK